LPPRCEYGVSRSVNRPAAYTTEEEEDDDDDDDDRGPIQLASKIVSACIQRLAACHLTQAIAKKALS